MAIENSTLSMPGSVIVPPGYPGGATTVGREAKPHKDDTSWVKLGIITSSSLNPGNMDEIKVHDSAPGHLVVDDIIAIGQERVLTFKCAEIQLESIRLAFATGPINPAAPQFNPDEGLSALRAWCKWQVFDNRDTLMLTVEMWGLLKIPSALELTNTTLTEVTYEFHGIRSALNTGT
jgi:hypothetical protein